MSRSKSETYILETIAKHGEVHAMRGASFGNRLLDAARKLESEGLVRVVEYHTFNNLRSSYRVISAIPAPCSPLDAGPL